MNLIIGQNEGGGKGMSVLFLLCINLQAPARDPWFGSRSYICTYIRKMTCEYWHTSQCAYQSEATRWGKLSVSVLTRLHYSCIIPSQGRLIFHQLYIELLLPAYRDTMPITCAHTHTHTHTHTQYYEVYIPWLRGPTSCLLCQLHTLWEHWGLPRPQSGLWSSSAHPAWISIPHTRATTPIKRLTSWQNSYVIRKSTCT